ncbi:hypothetical protein ACFX14_020388 [Malus domestica]
MLIYRMGRTKYWKEAEKVSEAALLDTECWFLAGDGSSLIRQKKRTLFRDCELPWASSMVYVRRGLHRKL